MIWLHWLLPGIFSYTKKQSTAVLGGNRGQNNLISSESLGRNCGPEPAIEMLTTETERRWYASRRPADTLAAIRPENGETSRYPWGSWYNTPQAKPHRLNYQNVIGASVYLFWKNWVISMGHWTWEKIVASELTISLFKPPLWPCRIIRKKTM